MRSDYRRVFFMHLSAGSAGVKTNAVGLSQYFIYAFICEYLRDLRD